MPILNNNQAQWFLDLTNNQQQESAVWVRENIKPPEDFSCWKWALFGLQNNVNFQGVDTGTLIHRPGIAFSRITENIPPPEDSFWNLADELAILEGYRADWSEADNSVEYGDNAVVRELRRTMMTNTITRFLRANGMVNDNPAAANDELVVKYDDTNAANDLILGPNETHWWLKLATDNIGNYVSVETFPPHGNNRGNLFIRRNAEHANNNVIRIGISSLTDFHWEFLNLLANDIQANNLAGHQVGP
ncbi:hypothetical protein [Vibrio coralliilyticus]|uniref:hypothetical protein n=1 Tax=Vibrio coralliilyticus TaxID=190893 RepID=UPI002FD208A5